MTSSLTMIRSEIPLLQLGTLSNFKAIANSSLDANELSNIRIRESDLGKDSIASLNYGVDSKLFSFSDL